MSLKTKLFVIKHSKQNLYIEEFSSTVYVQYIYILII